ncbi:MAG TPA: DUF1697 domain-containing protein [Terracidiphilus sp.]|jgi:uncharacterized protein (DUF1697 family)|nr:DUF1697 domain-containing protein [Terracidiphilus sp.]
MPTYVILLRAVNVGSTGKLPMADFRKLLADAKCVNVETYIQSGNAVVEAKCTAASLAKTVAAALAKYMGSPVPVIVRTHGELERIIAENPFSAEAAVDGARVHAVFLSAAPPPAKSKDLDQIVTKYPARRDRYHLAGDTLYLHLPDGAGESKFTAQSVDRILGVTGTARNWNTVLKLHAMSAR